ncbi:MAG: transcriptional regulator with AAA-type ATPase domain [Myxococcota bacterium]|jgi:transcriptional regulator with AAA-type ATPase domain
MARLSFEEGGRRLFEHQLRPGRTLLGRSDRSDVSLPSDTVSRVHCALERRTEGWWVVDRSRNGIRVNGAPVERHLLAHGDVIDLGIYSARFQLHVDDEPDVVTVTAAPRMAATHEALLDVGAGHVTTVRARLRFTSGPRSGDEVLLKRPRLSLGGTGAVLVLDPSLPRAAAHLRIVRGRVMVEPGDAAVMLDESRVRDITPVFEGEEVRIGDHAFVMEAVVDEAPRSMDGFGAMVGKSPGIRRVFAMLSRIAAHEDPVLITGESGTGKELAARGLHDGGPRHASPFITVNCAAIAENLFESELFGHEKGAFTGATARQDGAFHHADRGTLFLDEIGELRLDLQAKLLRALESGEVRRVGSSKPTFPDVRIVAATNRNLTGMVRAGTFREDLYFRLAVLTVHLPPLRDRAVDVVPLARTLVARNIPDARLAPDAEAALTAYSWPGNARELRNVLRRAYVLHGNVIRGDGLVFHPWSFDDGPAPAPARPAPMEDPERHLIVDALRLHDGNRTRAAKHLGMPRSSLLYKMKRMRIEVT